MHMKKFVLFFSVLALASCGTAYQQIAYISSPQMKMRDDGKFRYNEEDIVVDYNFWSKNGQVSFVITNNSDSDVYVDLSRSFLVVNGMTFDYFQNRTYSSNASSTVVSSSAYGASNTFAVANGIANALSSHYGSSGLSTAFSTVSETSTTTSHSRRSTSSSTINRGVEFAEKEGVWVPAHSSRHFCEFSLLEAPYRQCGLARNPSRREDASVAFTENNTPFAFDNMLMLVVDGAERRLVNSFFIERITNLPEEQTYEEKSDVDCNGRSTGEKIRIHKYGSANRFYINYNLDSKSPTDRQRRGFSENNRRSSRGRNEYEEVY